MSKYNSKKTVVDGQTFDSKKEARRYQELLLLEKAGEIQNLSRQVKFVLIPSQRDENGKVIERECSYKADVLYMMNRVEVEVNTREEAKADSGRE